MSTFLKELIWDHKVNFVGLQETMRKTYSDKFFKKIDCNNEFSWFWSPSNGKSGGMLSGIRKDRFIVQNFENGDFMIIANVFDKQLQKNWALANVYGPTQEELKNDFLTDLSAFCFKVKYPMLMGVTSIF